MWMVDRPRSRFRPGLAPFFLFSAEAMTCWLSDVIRKPTMVPMSSVKPTGSSQFPAPPSTLSMPPARLVSVVHLRLQEASEPRPPHPKAQWGCTLPAHVLSSFACLLGGQVLSFLLYLSTTTHQQNRDDLGVIQVGKRDPWLQECGET